MQPKLMTSRKAWITLAMAVLLVSGMALARGRPPGVGGGGGGKPPNPGGTESVGNNLSNPVIFAEGVGILGISSSTAVQGLFDYQQTWTGLRIPPNGNPTLPTGSEGTYCTVTVDPNLGCPSTDLYYLQGTNQTSWQATYFNGLGKPAFPVNVKWGDNLFGTPWTITSTIHLEVSMKSASTLGTFGFDTTNAHYFPTISLYGSGETETFGSQAIATDVDPATTFPGVYSEAAYLTIEKLSGPGGSVVGAPIHALATSNRAVEGPSTNQLTPEVNAGGSVVFSYNWFTGQDALTAGWYRLTFGVSPMTSTGVTGNAAIVGVSVPGADETSLPTLLSCVDAKTQPQCSAELNLSTLEIQLTGASSTGGGGGGGSGGPGRGRDGGGGGEGELNFGFGGIE